jgi:S-adenosylmethionine synthetase family protein
VGLACHNSPAFKAQFPEAGEDVKVMGSWQGRHLTLTVALAFVDRFIPDAPTYMARKVVGAAHLSGGRWGGRSLRLSLGPLALGNEDTP